MVLDLVLVNQQTVEAPFRQASLGGVFAGPEEVDFLVAEFAMPTDAQIQAVDEIDSDMKFYVHNYNATTPMCAPIVAIRHVYRRR